VTQDEDKGDLRKYEYILILAYMKYFVFIGYILGIIFLFILFS